MTDSDPCDYEGMEAAVALRLSRVCSGMPPEEFEQLVRTAALIQWKYEQRRDREAMALFGALADHSLIGDEQ
jgi:hypothetical protein